MSEHSTCIRFLHLQSRLEIKGFKLTVSEGMSDCFYVTNPYGSAKKFSNLDDIQALDAKIEKAISVAFHEEKL